MDSSRSRADANVELVRWVRGLTMMKNYALPVIALLVAMDLLMLSSHAEAGTTFPKMDLKYGHLAYTTMNNHKGSVKFAELVKERTGGNVNVQVFPNSQLGNEKDILEQVKTGLVHFSFTSPLMMANFDGWGPIGVLSMPYVIKGNSDQELAAKLIKLGRGPLMREINDKAAPISNIYALDMGWWYGQRHITTKNKRIEHPDDLKGLKIRTMDTPLAKTAFNRFGAVPVPMSLAELYTAMQMGVVDGQENPLNTINVGKYYEVQKYLSLTGHMVMNLMIVCNYKWFQGLSPELRELFLKAAMDASDYSGNLYLEDAPRDMESLKKNGMVVTEVNKAEFAEKTKDAWKQFEPLFGKGLYEKVQAEN